MRTATLHIGAHKTGTSAIQKSLDQARPDLLRHNCLYPRSIISKDYSHNNLSLSVVQSKTNDLMHYLHFLQQEITTYKNADLLISSEILEKTPIIAPEFLEIFLSVLSKYFTSINVVYCGRNEIELCDSVFKQKVGAPDIRYCESTETFIDHFFRSTPTYSEIVQSWKNIKHINNVYFFWYNSFDKNIENIFSACSLKDLSIKNPGIVNRSIDGKLLQLCYFYNNHHINDYNYNVYHFLKGLTNNLNPNVWSEPMTIFKEQHTQTYCDKLTTDDIDQYANILNAKSTIVKTKNIFSMPTYEQIYDYIKELYQINPDYHQLLYLL